jgi:hypothetical protein
VYDAYDLPWLDANQVTRWDACADHLSVFAQLGQLTSAAHALSQG